MARSFIEYTGDGSNKNYIVSFPFLSKNHVFASVGGTPATFTWANNTTITLNTAPTAGALVRIYRDTSSDTRLVDYAATSSLTEADLDLDGNQAFYLAQEAVDTARRGMFPNDANGQWDVAGTRLTNLGLATDPGDAVSKAYLDAVYIPILSGLVDSSNVAKAGADAAKVAAETARDASGAFAVNSADSASLAQRWATSTSLVDASYYGAAKYAADAAASALAAAAAAGGGAVKVDSNDTTANYLSSKIIAGQGIALGVVNSDTGNKLEISFSDKSLSNSITTNTTITVGLGKDFATLKEALAYLETKRITAAKVDIAVYGTVNESSEIVFTHTDGKNITLRGATPPANLTVTVNNSASPSASTFTHTVTSTVAQDFAVGDIIAVADNALAAVAGFYTITNVVSTTSVNAIRIHNVSATQSALFSSVNYSGANAYLFKNRVNLYSTYNGITLNKGTSLNIADILLTGVVTTYEESSTSTAELTLSGITGFFNNKSTASLYLRGNTTVLNSSSKVFTSSLNISRSLTNNGVIYSFSSSDTSSGTSPVNISYANLSGSGNLVAAYGLSGGAVIRECTGRIKLSSVINAGVGIDVIASNLGNDSALTAQLSTGVGIRVTSSSIKGTGITSRNNDENGLVVDKSRVHATSLNYLGPYGAVVTDKSSLSLSGGSISVKNASSPTFLVTKNSTLMNTGAAQLSEPSGSANIYFVQADIASVAYMPNVVFYTTRTTNYYANYGSTIIYYNNTAYVNYSGNIVVQNGITASSSPAVSTVGNNNSIVLKYS